MMALEKIGGFTVVLIRQNDVRRLVGVTTQLDLDAALYHGRLDNDAA